MVNSLSPITPSPRERNVSDKDSTKPRGLPRNDDFRKMRDKPPSKEEEEFAAAAEEREEAPSLFDLSKSAKPKPKPASKSQSPLKDEKSSESTFKGPITSRQGLEENLESGSEPLATSDEDEPSPLFPNKAPPASDKPPTTPPSAGKSPTTTPPPPPIADANAVPLKPFASMKSPPAQQQSPLTSTFEEASSQETPNLETLDQPVKGPVQTAPQIPDALKQQQEAAGALQGSQKVKLSREEAAADAGKIIKPAKKEKIEKKDKKEPDEAAVAARGDIASALNAGVQAVGLKTEKVQETPLKTDASIIKELAAQIVDRIDILRKGDETKTMITLQSPPVLKGATVTLTATESAKKEFNISFAGLSPDAKLLLDRKLKEDSLTQTLERKGIVVHTLTTSTQTETLLTAAPGQQTPRERQDQQQQQQQQQQRERERKGFQLEKEE